MKNVLILKVCFLTLAVSDTGLHVGQNFNMCCKLSPNVKARCFMKLYIFLLWKYTSQLNSSATFSFNTKVNKFLNDLIVTNVQAISLHSGN